MLGERHRHQIPADRGPLDRMTPTTTSGYLEARSVIFLLNEECLDLKDGSRRLNRLRRKVYRETPAATRSTGRGTALALWRAFTKKGFCCWCYEFGLAGTITHTVTIVEMDGVPQIHDAFFNLTYPLGFHDVLDALRDGRPVAAKTEIRDRKIYLSDPAFESEATVSWLEANADRELDPIDGLRRFEVLWNLDAFIATFPGIEAAYQDLEERGYPRDLCFLMLHPIEMFDGKKSHADRSTMPLLARRDLASPLAAARAAVRRVSRELVSERERSTEKDAAIYRLEGERGAAQSDLAAASTEARRLGDQIVQLRAALDDETRRFAAERQTLSQALTEAEAQAIASRVETAALRAELTQARAEWNAERDGWERDMASLQAAAGLWIEQSSQALQIARSELNAAASERQQVIAERDRIRADLATRLRAWENSPRRKFLAFLMRAIGKSAWKAPTSGN
jgi:predicted  nucleic acid-binding Zn-ribbon protein